MKQFALAVGLLVLPALVCAEDVWRWKDAQGRLHYTNISGTAPDGATAVKTQITIETDRLPGAPKGPDLVVASGNVSDGAESAPAPAAKPRAKAAGRTWYPPAPRVYDDARLRFGCLAGTVLYNGGFSHADDIVAAFNCIPYRIGVQAWLNAAKAELALRENGISVGDVLRLYGPDWGM